MPMRCVDGVGREQAISAASDRRSGGRWSPGLVAPPTVARRIDTFPDFVLFRHFDVGVGVYKLWRTKQYGDPSIEVSCVQSCEDYILFPLKPEGESCIFLFSLNFGRKRIL